MYDIERDRAKALSAMRSAITKRPATWTSEDILEAIMFSGAVVWASNYNEAISENKRLRRDRLDLENEQIKQLRNIEDSSDEA